MVTYWHTHFPHTAWLADDQPKGDRQRGPPDRADAISNVRPKQPSMAEQQKWFSYMWDILLVKIKFVF